MSANTYWISDAHVSCELPKEKTPSVYWRTVNFLASLGFTLGEDPHIGKNYPSLNKSHRVGVWRDLWVAVEYSGIRLYLSFFQTIVTVNPNGGRYDSGRTARMPYLIRLRYRLVVRKLRGFLSDLGLVDVSLPDTDSMPPLDRIREHIRRSGHFRGGDPLVDWKPEYSYNRTDRDGKLLEPGQRKYFYTYGGRLATGIVYYNLNNMWWVHAGGSVYNMSSGQLFDFQPGLSRRLKLGRADVLDRLEHEISRALRKRAFQRVAEMCLHHSNLLKSEVAA